MKNTLILFSAYCIFNFGNMVVAQTTKTTTTEKTKNTTTTPSKGKSNSKNVESAKPANVKGKKIETIQPVKATEKTTSTPATKVENVSKTTLTLSEGAISNEQLEKYTKEVVENKPNGKVNWTQQFVEAKGQSVIDTTRFKNPAQAKAMAIRGAVVVAQRNLLEITKGVNVVGETTVQDMITTGDYIYTRVEGLVKGAQQVGQARDVNGMMEVTLKMPIYGEAGLASAFSNEDLSAARKKGGVKNESETLTSEMVATDAEVVDGSKPFVFNFKGKQIDPSMFPVIVDEQGNVKLDFSKWYDGKTGTFPKYMQLGKEVMNDLGFKKGVDVIDLVQNSNGQFTVPQNSNKKVVWQKIGNVAQKIGKVLFSFL